MKSVMLLVLAAAASVCLAQWNTPVISESTTRIPAAGDVMIYDGANWTNRNISAFLAGRVFSSIESSNILASSFSATNSSVVTQSVSVVRLVPQATAPTPFVGGLYVSTNNSYYVSTNGTSWIILK